MGTWKHIKAVIRREMRIFRQRPLYLIGSIGAMAFSTIFFLTFFKDGLPHDLPIGIVDNDNSSLSRNFIQQLDATQLGAVVQFDDFEQARAAMMSGKITSICVIPEGMYADVSANRRPVFTYYLNTLYFVGGSLAYQEIQTMISLTNGAVQREVLRAKGMNESAIMGRIRPIDIDTHRIGNVTLNYGYYLANMMLPGILELLVIIVMIYSLGTELKYGTSKHLLKTTEGSMIDALLGKVIVFTILFSALGLIMVIAMYHWMHFPIAGSIWNMFLAVVLLVISSECVAIFIIGCLPIPRLALSIGALYSVFAFSMTGFTLPVEALPSYVQGLATGFPLRHYFLIYSSEVYFAGGFAGWWPEIIHLLLFLFLPLTVVKRLKGAYQNLNFPTY